MESSTSNLHSVAHQLVRRLADLGVTRVFSIPGGASSGLEVALLDEPRIEQVVCVHEATAGYMATGHHLATGEVGVLFVTSGPGALNAAPALAAAEEDGLGLLVVAGDVARSNAGRGALQDGGPAGLDLVHAMRPLCSSSSSVHRPEQAMALFESAVSHCVGLPRGSAFLQIPIDVQTSEVVGQAFERPRRGPPKVSDEALDRIADAWNSARNPTLMLGVGTTRAGIDAQVRGFSSFAGAPVVADAESLGVVARDDPFFVGLVGVGDTGEGSAWLEHHEVDLLLQLGCRLDDTTTAGFSPAIEAIERIQLDHDPGRLGRGFTASLAVHCDIGDALDRLRERIPRASTEQGRARMAEIAVVRGRVPSAATNLQAAPHDPRAVVASLRRHYPDATFVSDIGNHLLATLGALHVEQSYAMHVSIGLGGMGSGIGSALGMSATRRTVCICGDGGTLMSGNELYTAVRKGWPVTYCVFVDGALGMVHGGVTRVYGRSHAYDLPRFDAVGWARSLGCDAALIRSDEDLRAAVASAEGPLVLAFEIDPSVEFHNPRESVIHFGE